MSVSSGRSDADYRHVKIRRPLFELFDLKMAELGSVAAATEFVKGEYTKGGFRSVNHYCEVMAKRALK